MEQKNTVISDDLDAGLLALQYDEHAKNLLADKEIQINDFVNDECTVLKLEDILYFKADGNYTRLFLTNDYSENEKYKLITKKIGELEEELKKYPMVRVHKSYMVNLLNVTDVGQYVTLQGTEEKIPVGRSFKEAVYKRYVDYAQDKVRLRIGWKK